MQQPDDLRGACTMLVEIPATYNQQLPGSTYMDCSQSDPFTHNVADVMVYKTFEGDKERGRGARRRSGLPL